MIKAIILLMLVLLILISCSIDSRQSKTEDDNAKTRSIDKTDTGDDNKMTKETQTEIATFSGGCFWCIESSFEHYEGIDKVISGYTGGEKINPTYKEVSSGKTGHLESVEIHYDPNKITYNDLLEIFWRLIDPTDGGGSFIDRGPQYRSAIFYHNEEQRRLAEESRHRLEESDRYDKPIVTEIRPVTRFYPAEEYHQDYSNKNPAEYKSYSINTGRDQYRDDIWGDDKDYKAPEKQDEVIMMHEKDDKPWENFVKPGDDEIQETLTPLQYEVTQNEGTEKPFENEYLDNKEDGIYIDILSGEPLFSSLDKYESGTGWPSFTKPLEPDNIIEKEDNSLFTKRMEVRSSYGDNHLGHVFNDGPEPTGQRYCMNSAALRFIPIDDLEKEGYGKYLSLFQQT